MLFHAATRRKRAWTTTKRQRFCIRDAHPPGVTPTLLERRGVLPRLRAASVGSSESDRIRQFSADRNPTTPAEPAAAVASQPDRQLPQLATATVVGGRFSLRLTVCDSAYFGLADSRKREPCASTDVAKSCPRQGALLGGQPSLGRHRPFRGPPPFQVSACFWHASSRGLEVCGRLARALQVPTRVTLNARCDWGWRPRQPAKAQAGKRVDLGWRSALTPYEI